MKTDSQQSNPEFPVSVYDSNYLLNLSVRFIYPLIKKYLTCNARPSGRLLDLGCGNGSILKALRDDFCSRFSYTGYDLYANRDDDTQNPIIFKQTDLNADFSLQHTEDFNILISCEVLEHVIDTDQFMVHANKMLKLGGLFILTTPNLGSFFNRLLLLIGLQPLHTEVSWQNPYLGREILYKITGQERSPAAGHLRLFTAHALRKFVQHHGFVIRKFCGFSPYGGLMGMVSRLFGVFPSLMPGLFVVLEKKTGEV